MWLLAVGVEGGKSVMVVNALAGQVGVKPISAGQLLRMHGDRNLG